MKDTLLKEKPLFQATLGDLIEALNEGFANEGKDGRANTNPSSLLRVSNKKWGRKYSK